jgi:hypothetical protein
MTRQEVEAWLDKNGYERDKWGHYQRTRFGDRFRLKLSKLAVRHEVKSRYGWLRVKSAYYSHLRLDETGDLVGWDR